jgi:hypothetical protein
MQTLKKQALTAKKILLELSVQHRAVQSMQDARLKLELAGYPIAPSERETAALAKIDKLRARLDRLPPHPVAVARAAIELPDLRADLRRTERTLSDTTTQVPSDPGALPEWTAQVQALTAQRDQLRAAIAAAQVLADQMPAPATGGARPGAGRPRGGSRTPAQWLERVDVGAIEYDTDTGHLIYRGRTVTADRVTVHRIPRGVLIAAARGITAEAVPTLPPGHPERWAWRHLLMTRRTAADGTALPDIRCDGAPHVTPPHDPQAEIRRMRWREAKRRQRMRDADPHDLA